MLLGPGLLAAFGTEHRRQRKLLNPAFSIAHMRGLSPIFYNVAGKVRSGLAFHPFYVDFTGYMRLYFSSGPLSSARSRTARKTSMSWNGWDARRWSWSDRA